MTHYLNYCFYAIFTAWNRLHGIKCTYNTGIMQLLTIKYTPVTHWNRNFDIMQSVVRKRYKNRLLQMHAVNFLSQLTTNASVSH
jgi:hypothetical protein